MKREIIVQVDAVTFSLSAPRAVELRCRGILSDHGIEDGSTPFTPRVDVERALPVTVEPTREPARAPARTGTRICDAEQLIIDKDTGKYPHDSDFRKELVRSIQFAAALWGADTSWESIEESHWTTLLRRRCEQLVAKKCKAIRATEITVSRLITVVGWLRDTKRIPRDAASWPRDFKKQISQYWKAHTGSDRDQQPDRQRYTLVEFQSILAKADFDPRLDLLLRLAVGLRPGQVARARRGDLKLPTIEPRRDAQGRDITNYGAFTVHGAGKKGGGVVALTCGQRRAVDAALTDGYLAHVEDEHKRQARADYRLFPSGYVVGRVGMLRGKETKLALASGINFERHVTSSWLRKNWRRAEARAGIPHISGRCTYGQRRLTVDVGVAEGLTPSGIQGLGLWADADMPLNVYAEGANSAGQMEARGVRALMLGEAA